MAGAESSSSDSEALDVTERAYTTAHVEGGAVICAVEYPALVLDLSPTEKKTAARAPRAISVEMRPGGLCFGCWDERKYAPCNSNWNRNCVFSWSCVVLWQKYCIFHFSRHPNVSWEMALEGHQVPQSDKSQPCAGRQDQRCPGGVMWHGPYLDSKGLWESLCKAESGCC